MPPTSMKNAPLGAAATDLGFGGDQLLDMLQQQQAENRKKLNPGQNPADYGDGVVGGLASQTLFGGLGSG